MKNAVSLLIFAVSLAAVLTAKADPSYLYFDVEAYDPEEWHYFAVARIGIADSDGATGEYLANLFYNPSSGSYERADWAESIDAEGTTTGNVWAEIAEEYANKNYWFYVETVPLEDGDPSWGYDAATAVNFTDLSSHIVGDITKTQSAAVTPWVVPEPTSAVLLLLGLAGLALRRKVGRVMLVLCLPLLTFGAADDTLISFSTKGPDKYLDGTTVKDGECYALIWTHTGATFEGIAADGKAVGTNSQVIVFAPVAKGGCCPPVLFELDAALAKQFEDGAYGVYLLDTRLASGAVGGVNAAGLPVAVNGYGEVKVEGEGVGVGEGVGEGVGVVTAKSSLPANAPKPQITAIRLVGDNVFLTVRNTLPCLQYTAKEVKGLGVGVGEGVGVEEGVGAAVQGVEAGEITIIAPKKGDSGFYSVGRE